MLRHVDATSATVWVETDRPCTVTVTAGAVGASEATWSVHGHHYAVLAVQGLAPGTTTEYAVALDDRTAWPPADARFPPSTIRTLRPDGELRLAFGSCRRAEPLDAGGLAAFGPDALVELAERLRTAPAEELPGLLPDLMLMVGDQVYADRPSAAVAALLEPGAVGDTGEQAPGETSTFEEYTWLYAESWGPEPVRWLLSTVPTAMVLDDHDLRDDWNSSAAWREEVTAEPWWRARVVGAFASYWVYQHLGNLSPAELAASPLLAQLRAGDDTASTAALDAFAWRADAEPQSARWSFSRDLGAAEAVVRLVVADVRCRRRLDPDDRAIMDDEEWAWVVERATTPPPQGRVEHLLLVSTLPLLLLHGLSDVEGWNEAVVAGRWGRRAAAWGERVRRYGDLEHWPAFSASFAAAVGLLTRVAGSERPPSTVLVLSGDVHCSYTARARLPEVSGVRGVHGPRTAVHQLVMSPFRNPLHLDLRFANRLAQLRLVRALVRLLALSAGVRRPPVRWTVDAGPWFDNGVMTVVLDGPSARAEVEHVRADRRGAATHPPAAAGPLRRSGRARPPAARPAARLVRGLRARPALAASGRRRLGGPGLGGHAPADARRAGAAGLARVAGALARARRPRRGGPRRRRAGVGAAGLPAAGAAPARGRHRRRRRPRGRGAGG